jgi:hypothetical protein
LNQKFTMSSYLHPSSPSTDHLSLALHTISCSNITHLRLIFIPMSPSIFHGATPADPPFWPNLECLEIILGVSTATGEWYWELDPENPEAVDAIASDSGRWRRLPRPGVGSHDSNSDDSDVPDYYNLEHEMFLNGMLPVCCFRTKVCPDTFNPLMLAMARAVPSMPRIRRLYIKSGLRLNNHSIAVWYSAAGHRGGVQPGNEWYVEAVQGAKWKVPKELMEAWLECVETVGDVKIDGGGGVIEW